MIDRLRRFSLFLGMGMVLQLGPVSSWAVTDRIAPADSLDASTIKSDETFGAGTTWMIGMTLVEQGDLAGALPYLAQAWRMSPDEGELGEIYRDVLLELGYARDALEVSRSVLSSRPDDPRAREQHVIILATLEQYDEALAGLDDLNVDHPDSVRLDRLKVEMLLRARRWPEARDHIRRVLDRNPDDAERLTATLAEVLELQGELDEAANVWSEAVNDYPLSRPLRIGAIQFEVGRGRDREALDIAIAADASGLATADEQDFDWVTMTSGQIAGEGRVDVVRTALLELSENGDLSLVGTLFLARILDAGEERGRALELLRQAIGRWPDAVRPRIYLAEYLALSGDLAAAEQTIRDGMLVVPDDLEAGFSLLSILSRRYPEAYATERPAESDAVRREIIDLARRLSLRSDDITTPSHLMLGATFHGLGLHDEAIAHYETAAGDPEYQRDALLSLSVVYDDLDQPDEVRAVLERLHGVLPEDAVVQNALGYTLADQGRDLERAATLIRAAVSHDPENPAYLDSLGWVLFRQGQDLDAFDYLVRAANALPEDPVILEHLARVLLRLGQVDRSEGVARRALEAGGSPESLADLLPVDREP